MFDELLKLVNGTVAWTKANLDSYGVPTSTTVNAGGFDVIDLGKTGAQGISVVAIFPTAATANGTKYLELTIEACDDAAFPSAIKELLTFGGATIRRIIPSETPAVFIGRVSTTLRYIRAKAVGQAGCDFKLAQVLLTPYAFNVL